MRTRPAIWLVTSAALVLAPDRTIAQLLTTLEPTPAQPVKEVEFVCARPDGIVLVTVGDDAAFWERGKAQPFLILPAKDSNYAPGFSGDGRRFVFASLDDRNQYAAVIVDVSKRQVLRTIPRSGYYMALNGDGTGLALSTNEGVAIHDVTTGDLTTTIPIESEVLGLAYSPNGKWLAVAVRADKDRIQIFDAKSFQRISTSRSFATSQPKRLFFSSDSQILYSVHDELLGAWDPQSGAKRPIINPQKMSDWVEKPKEFAVSPAGNFLASVCPISGSRSQCLVISNLDNGDIRCMLPIPESASSVAFAGEDRVLIASGHRFAQLWNWPMMSRFHDTPLLSVEIRGSSKWDSSNAGTYGKVVFSPDSSTVALIHAGPLPNKPVKDAYEHAVARYVTLIDVKRGILSLVFSPKALKTEEMLHDLAYTPDGHLLIAADKFIGRWSASTKKYTDVLTGDRQFFRIGLDREGKKCFVATASGSVASPLRIESHELFDLMKGNLAPTLKYKARVRPSFAVSPDGTRIARKFELLDAQTGEELQAPDPSDEDLHEPDSAVFTSDGRRVIGYDNPEGLVVWDLDSNDVSRPLPLFRQDGAFALSLDSKRVATGQQDGLIHLWDLQKREVLITLRSHAGPIVGLSFAPDGTKLASLSSDRTVKVWDVSSYNVD